jgi:hypothetical protein
LVCGRKIGDGKTYAKETGQKVDIIKKGEKGFPKTVKKRGHEYKGQLT